MSVQTNAPVAPSRPAVLLTKLHPPAVRDEVLVRERLFERLRSGSQAQLTLVAAPAGSGKTTLLAAWHETESRDRPVAWMTLDRGDDDPVVLWSHVLESLGRADPTLAVPSFASFGASVVDALLPSLVNTLDEHEPVVLVFDDFHRLSPGLARESVGWFVEHAPPSVQCVVATRTEPHFALASLRAHGELVELRDDDLRFTREEIAELINARLGLGLATGDLDLLEDRTAGWAAGIYLATHSLARVDDQHAFLVRFGGTERHVVDFLSDEVLATHDPAIRELMAACAVLGRFCGPLCDFALEREGSAALLAELSQANLFLVPLEGEAGWYKFHQLFSQLLLMELGRYEPGYAATLHRRASVWHVEHGTLDEAIEHALDGEAFVEAADLISESWPLYMQAFRFESVISWLARFPENLRLGDARLLTAAAWCQSHAGRRIEAAAAIASVEQLPSHPEGPLPDGFSSVESSLALLRAIFTWGDIRLATANAHRAVELEGPDSPWRSAGCLAVGMSLYFGGKPVEADSWLEEAAELAAATEQWLTAGPALAYRSLAAGDRGLIDQQTRLEEQAAEIARQHGLGEINAEIHVAVGMSLVARGRVDEAWPELAAGVAGLRNFGDPVYLVYALVQQATALKEFGERAGCAAAVAEARAMIETYPDLAIFSDRLDGLERTPAATPPAGGELSERELTVLRLLSGPLSEKEIGNELFVSQNTVHSHVRSIYRKLGVSSRSDAVARARTLKLN